MDKKESEEMDLREIKEIIKYISKLDVSEVSLHLGKTKLRVRNSDFSEEQANPNVMLQSVPHPVMAPLPETPLTEPKVTSPEPTVKATPSNLVEIKSPMIGTVYHKPSPDKPNFVKIGDQINVGDPVCVVEAMKLFNEIESDISGTVVEILVDDASPVEFGQPLFLVDPS